jgi:hypothetical protein
MASGLATPTTRFDGIIVEQRLDVLGGAVSRFLGPVLAAVAAIAVVVAPAGAATDGDTDGDSVVGSGGIMVFNPLPPPPTVRLDLSVDAHADASGGNPSGAVSIFFPAAGVEVFSGPVSCLEVSGNTAFVGFEDRNSGHTVIRVEDNSATGSPDIVSRPVGLAAGCSIGGPVVTFPLVDGDLVVHDAPPLTSTDQCKDGGWRDFTDDAGHPFKNQGACIAFLRSGPSPRR